MSYTLAIRDALATHAEAQTVGHNATVSVGLAPPVHTLAELGTLRVDIIPLSVRTEPATRAARDHDIAIEIGFAQRISDDAPTPEDLLELVETLNDSLVDLRLSEAVFVSSTIDTLTDEEDYRTRRVFRALITATYRIRR